MLAQNQILSDRYQLIHCLSEKVGRQTWKAIDRQTNRTVVLKVLLFGTGIQWQEVKLFEREAELLRSLNLPQIPRYLDDFELDLPEVKGFVLVQTYLDARSLEFYLESGYTFAPAEVRDIAERLLRLLSDLHSRTVPVIHRDIKPSNILLSDRSAHSLGQLYLVDFGSAMTYGLSGKGTVTIVGTFGYIPPEQFVGQTVPASDLYSLGITLIALLTGMKDDALSHSPGRIDLESLTGVDLALVRWLQKMTEPTLERRFRSAKEALDALTRPEAIESKKAKYKKPANTRIQLEKSIDRLSIRIPKSKLEDFAPLFCFSLVLTLLCILADKTIFSFWVLFLLSFNCLQIFYFLSGYYTLTITSEKIQLSHHRWGICLRSRSFSRKDILKLERINPYIKLKKDFFGNSYTIEEPTILIWAGAYPYQLLAQSTPELDWLAQELSDCLEMPIEYREFPIIKV